MQRRSKYKTVHANAAAAGRTIFSISRSSTGQEVHNKASIRHHDAGHVLFHEVTAISRYKARAFPRIYSYMIKLPNIMKRYWIRLLGQTVRVGLGRYYVLSHELTTI